jgi:hypothetical protein
VDGMMNVADVKMGAEPDGELYTLGLRLGELDRLTDAIGAMLPRNDVPQLLACTREAEDEVLRLEDALLNAEPTTLADAVVLAMMACNRARSAEDFVDNQWLTRSCCAMLRRALDIFACHAGVDLDQIGGNHYLSDVERTMPEEIAA